MEWWGRIGAPRTAARRGCARHGGPSLGRLWAITCGTTPGTLPDVLSIKASHPLRPKLPSVPALCATAASARLNGALALGVLLLSYAGRCTIQPAIRRSPWLISYQRRHRGWAGALITYSCRSPSPSTACLRVLNPSSSSSSSGCCLHPSLYILPSRVHRLSGRTRTKPRKSLPASTTTTLCSRHNPTLPTAFRALDPPRSSLRQAPRRTLLAPRRRPDCRAPALHLIDSAAFRAAPPPSPPTFIPHSPPLSKFLSCSPTNNHNTSSTSIASTPPKAYGPVCDRHSRNHRGC